MDSMGGKQLVNKVLVLLVIAAVAGAALGGLWLLPPGEADASGHIATRSFSKMSVDPGDTVRVTIVARGHGRVGRIEETVPSGFMTSDGSATVTFRLIEADPATRTYMVTATGSPGPYTFSGTFSDAMRESRAVGGADTVTITRPQATPTPMPTPTPTAVPGPTASRSMPASVAPGAQFSVRVRADNYGRLGRIVENLPSGFTSPEAVGQTVTFRLLEAGPQTKSYMVTAPDTLGTSTFSGTLEDDDRNTHPVGGASRVTVKEPDPANKPPAFRDVTATRSVRENQPAGARVGGPVTATDPDDGDALQYSLEGADQASFNIGETTGQLTTRDPLDHEARDTYMVTVTARDGGGLSESIAVTVRVTNVDEDGTLTLSSMAPVVGTAVTATLTDPDDDIRGQSWQWDKSMNMAGTWMDISGATSSSYTPMAADEGYYLRATVMYTDGHGPGKEEMATTSGMVAAAPDTDPNAALIARYDADNSGTIEKSEVIKAINDYLFGTGEASITKAQVITLINCYLFGC